MSDAGTDVYAAPAAADPEYAGYSSEWFTGTLATAAAAGTYALGSDVVAPTEVVGIDLDADGRGYAIDFTPHRLLRVVRTHRQADLTDVDAARRHPGSLPGRRLG